MDKLALPPSLLDQLFQLLIQSLATSVTTSVINAIRAEQAGAQQDKLFTTAEVADLFGVTTVTISSWISKGLLQKYTMGGRNRFKYSEVMESMKTLKKYRVK